VQFETELLAVLFVAKRDPYDYSDHQVTLLSSLANAAAIALNNARLYGRLVTSMSMQQRLLGAAVAGAGSAAVVAVLADLLDSSVALVDWQHRLLAETRKPGSHLALPDELPPCSDDETGLAVRPIVVGGSIEGYLVTRIPRASADLDNLAIEQAATVLTLELAKDKLAEDVALRFRGGLLTELQHYSAAEDARLRRQAAQLGCDLDHQLIVMSMQVSDEDSGPIVTAAGMQSRQRLLQIMRAETRHANLPALISERPDEVAVLLRTGDEQQVRQLMDRVFTQSRRGNLPPVLAGASHVAETLDELPLAFAESARALAVARRQPSASALVRFADLGFHDLLMGAQVPADLSAHAQRVLRPLLAHDDGRGAELVPTLRSFLLNVGNAEAVARELNIHPNTARGRLGRIASLLGCDLNSAEVRLDLHLALEAAYPRQTTVMT
jgi:DNA-binding PucR family transcriptional regulator